METLFIAAVLLGTFIVIIVAIIADAAKGSTNKKLEERVTKLEERIVRLEGLVEGVSIRRGMY